MLNNGGFGARGDVAGDGLLNRFAERAASAERLYSVNHILRRSAFRYLSDLRFNEQDDLMNQHIRIHSGKAILSRAHAG